MKDVQPTALSLDLRPPEEIMRLRRIGAFFPTRLSFMRSLIRQLAEAKAQVTRPVWQMDAEGFGRAVYSVTFGGHSYSLVAFSTPLDPKQRTDRVIAEAWDTTYVLFDGVPSAADLDRLSTQVPLQEAGRFTKSELVLARANKSLRLFAHAAERLSEGAQPDSEMVRQIGYLMRTTAVYGNGKFGIADRARFAHRPLMADPFRAEMLTVWLIRGFTLDLVEHVAAQRSDRAVPIAPGIRRYLGIGNATGLGMAPFLVNHPVLLNNWMTARETALARVRRIKTTTPEQAEVFRRLLARTKAHLADWQVEDPRQARRIATLRAELDGLIDETVDDCFAIDWPWECFYQYASNRSVEFKELTVSLLLEPHGALIDDLTHEMFTEREPILQPRMEAADLAQLIEAHFAWTRQYNFTERSETQFFWYVSEEKKEPRLGDRFLEPGAELESPLDIARQVHVLEAALQTASPDTTVAEIAMRWPRLRTVIARVQAAPAHPYSEVQDNLIGSGCLPIDLLRCKLSIFGASKFDPKSDRWTRITLFQGAPGFQDLEDPQADDWLFPVLDA